MRFSVSRSPSPVQRAVRRPTNAYSIHNITDDEDSSSSESEVEEVQALTFSHAGTRDASLSLSRLVRSTNSTEHNVDTFLNAVKLRKADPIEEYQNAQRAAIKSAHPVPSLPHVSQSIAQSYSALQAKRNADEMAAVLAMVERLDIQHKGKEEESMRRVREGNKGMWEGIEGAIRRDEKKRVEEEKKRLEEERKRLEEERKRAELKAAEDRKKAEEEKKKKEREEEERRQKENEDKNRAEEIARKAALEKEAQEKAARAQSTSVPAIQEWENAWAERTALKKLTKSVEENPELRSVAGRLRRKLRTRVGQVTNSLSELEKLADAIHEIVSSHSDPVYTALLSAFAKYLLLQAETEVTAKLATAYPLARLVWLVVARGHPKLWHIFWARFVGRTGGWGVGAHLTRKAGTSDTEWRKLTGRELQGKHDPDDKPPTIETTAQYTDRIVGQLALYAALVQTDVPAQIQIDSIPEAFRLPRMWTWLARVLNSSELLGHPSAPQCLSVVLEVAGDKLGETYGAQFGKLVRAVGEVVTRGVGGESETGARVRLGLMVERWEKEHKFGLDGRHAER